MNGIIQQLIANPDKFSLQEIMKGVQDGVIPSYIGTPLIADKTKQQQQAQMAAQGAQPAKPPIAQQIMQQAEAQTQPQGVEGLPTELPTRMAQGGILNFADGGMYDDNDENAQAEEDYYKQQEEEGGMGREDQHLFDRLMDQAQASNDEDEEEPQPQAMPQPKNQGISALPAVATASYEAAHHAISSKEEGKPRETHAEGAEHITKHKTGSHPYEAMVLEEARRQGVDPRIAMHVLYKETGGVKDPATAMSPAGAGGVMQLMPATAKGLNVTDLFDPVQNVRGGVSYLAQLQKQFGEPKLVAAAYNAGPGNVRKYGGVPPFAETQAYVQGLAQGGSVQHFDAGKLVSGDPIGNYFRSMPSTKDNDKNLQDYEDLFGATLDPESLANGQLMTQTTPLTVPYQGNAGRGNYGGPTATQLASAAPKTPVPKAAPTTDMSAFDMDVPYAATQAAPSATSETKPTSEEYNSPYMQKMLDWIEGNQKDINKSKSEDKYMALIAAGLGMMGGTSPYAAANIGQGASQGLGYLMNARKMQMAQENGVQSGLLGLSRADLYERMHQAQEATRRETTQAKAAHFANMEDIARNTGITNAAKVENANRISMAKNAIAATKLFNDSEDPQMRARYAKQYNTKDWMSNPEALRNYTMEKNAFINQLAMSGGLEDNTSAPNSSSL